MSDRDLIYGERYGDLWCGFVRALNDLGRDRLADFDPGDLFDISVQPALVRAVLRAEASLLLDEADRTRHPDHLPYRDESDRAADLVVCALLDRFVERRAAGIPIPEPSRLPPPAA